MLNLLRLEDNYDILINNYVELEETVLSLATKSFVFRRLNQAQLDTDRRTICRRLMNLFTSTRAYLDQAPQILNRLTDTNRHAGNAFRSDWEEERTLSLGCRAVEALRNHTQHYALPIESVVYHFEWVGAHFPREKLVTSVIPMVDMKQLRRDKKFPAAILDEVERVHTSNAPLLPLVCEYIVSISTVHAKVRDRESHRMKSWCATLSHYADESLAREPGHAENIAAIALAEDDSILDVVPLGIRLSERIQVLMNKNHRLVSLPKLNVTSRM